MLGTLHQLTGAVVGVFWLRSRTKYPFSLKRNSELFLSVLHFETFGLICCWTKLKDGFVRVLVVFKKKFFALYFYL